MKTKASRVRCITSCAFFKVKNVFQLVTLCLLGGLVLINLFAISEVYERQALDRWLRTVH